MLVEFLVDWRRHKAGDIVPWLHRGSANVLIRRGKVKEHEPPKPKQRSRKAASKTHDN